MAGTFMMATQPPRSTGRDAEYDVLVIAANLSYLTIIANTSSGQATTRSNAKQVSFDSPVGSFRIIDQPSLRYSRSISLHLTFPRVSEPKVPVRTKVSHYSHSAETIVRDTTIPNHRQTRVTILAYRTKTDHDTM